MNKLIKLLNEHSDSIWGENLEAITPKEEVKRVHFSELYKLIEK